MKIYATHGPFALQYVVHGEGRTTRHDSLNAAISAAMRSKNALITHGDRTVGWAGSDVTEFGPQSGKGAYARSSQQANAGETALFALFQPARLTRVRGMGGISVRENRALGPLVHYDPALYTPREARAWERECRV